MSAISINKHNFQEEILNSDKNVLIDFFADWCGPCQRVSPVIDEIARENPDIKVGKINVDEQPQLAAHFGIVSIPTVKVFRGGQCTASLVGLRSQAELEALIR